MEDPSISMKSLRQLALFFFIQGELKQSNIMEAMRQKHIHFIKNMDDENYREAALEWEKLNNF